MDFIVDSNSNVGLIYRQFRDIHSSSLDDHERDRDHIHDSDHERDRDSDHIHDSDHERDRGVTISMTLTMSVIVTVTMM